MHRYRASRHALPPCLMAANTCMYGRWTRTASAVCRARCRSASKPTPCHRWCKRLPPEPRWPWVKPSCCAPPWMALTATATRSLPCLQQMQTLPPVRLHSLLCKAAAQRRTAASTCKTCPLVTTHGALPVCAAWPGSPTAGHLPIRTASALRPGQPRSPQQICRSTPSPA